MEADKGGCRTLYQAIIGNDCVIDSIKSLSENPVLQDVDTSVEPTIATYSVTIQVDYLDSSNKLWK